LGRGPPCVDIGANRLVATFPGNVKVSAQMRLFRRVPVVWGNDWVHADTVYSIGHFGVTRIGARGDILVANEQAEAGRGIVRVYRYTDAQVIGPLDAGDRGPREPTTNP
jgi:hypothetical protein